MSAPSAFHQVLIVYDGDCYFCRSYVSWLRLQAAVGPVELLSARSADDRVSHFMRQGVDLDDGMLVVTALQMHRGADAMHWLAQNLPAHSIAERLHAAVFGRRWLARLLYPLLRWGRRAWLALRGVPPLGDHAR